MLPSAAQSSSWCPRSSGASLQPSTMGHCRRGWRVHRALKHWAGGTGANGPPMDHLAGPRMAWRKQGLDQLVGEVRAPSDERPETWWGLCPALPVLFPLPCLLGISQSNVNKAVPRKRILISSALQLQWGASEQLSSQCWKTHRALGQQQDTSSCN